MRPNCLISLSTDAPRLKRLVNPRFLRFRQRAVQVRKDRQFRMLLVELPNRRANRLDATPGPLGQTARNLRLAAAGSRQASSPIDDLLSLFVGKLAEPRTASHALLIRLHEPIDAAPQKTHALAAIKHQPPAHEPQLAPTRNGLGRNVELLGQLFDREHLLADVVGCHVGGIRQILDEQPQIVPQIFAGDFARAPAQSADSR